MWRILRPGHPRCRAPSDLDTEQIHFVQRKGEDSEVDSCSAFRDDHAERTTGLDRELKQRGIGELDICGLATDYCVKFSALDAAALLPGVKVRVIENASRGITPEGRRAALAECSRPASGGAALNRAIGADFLVEAAAIYGY